MRIKQLREERGISQRALAIAIKANPKTVNFWERGASEPTAGFIIALANFFECSADYILGREDDMGNIIVDKGLTMEEQAVVGLYRKLGKKQKDALMSFAAFLYSNRV